MKIHSILYKEIENNIFVKPTFTLYSPDTIVRDAPHTWHSTALVEKTSHPLCLRDEMSKNNLKNSKTNTQVRHAVHWRYRKGESEKKRIIVERGVENTCLASSVRRRDGNIKGKWNRFSQITVILIALFKIHSLIDFYQFALSAKTKIPGLTVLCVFLELGGEECYLG